MTNYSKSQFSIVGDTGDFNTESTIFQEQSTATPSFDFKEYQFVLGNVSGTDYNITKSQRAGWLTGRRPVTGQLYPRGVYNK